MSDKQNPGSNSPSTAGQGTQAAPCLAALLPAVSPPVEAGPVGGVEGPFPEPQSML